MASDMTRTDDAALLTAMRERLNHALGEMMDNKDNEFRMWWDAQVEAWSQAIDLVYEAASRRPVDDGRVETVREWLIEQAAYQRAQPSDGYALGAYDAYRAVRDYLDTLRPCDGLPQGEDTTPSEGAE